MNVITDRVAARVLATVVLGAAGDVSVVRQQVRELRVDWRDVLLVSGTATDPRRSTASSARPADLPQLAVRR